MKKFSILHRARAVIDAEADALRNIPLDRNFARAVRILKACRGKIITTGLGKAGIIAQKIAATLCSNGTPAAFVHPGDSAHGDLGILHRNDVIIACSTSGKTREVIEMLELAHHFRRQTHHRNHVPPRFRHPQTIHRGDQHGDHRGTLSARPYSQRQHHRHARPRRRLERCHHGTQRLHPPSIRSSASRRLSRTGSPAVALHRENRKIKPPTPMMESLEQQLDSFDPARRRQALLDLLQQSRDGGAAMPEPGTDVNLHAHTFFSYNAYGYSPSKFAWLARKAGLAVAGVVDFDVLDALEEFMEAGPVRRLENLRQPGIARVRAGVCDSRHQFPRRTRHRLSHGRWIHPRGPASVSCRNACDRHAAHPRPAGPRQRLPAAG